MFSLGGVEAEVLDEAAERKAFQEAVAAWRSGNAPPSPPSPVKCGGSLLDGEYDEAAEQAAFQEAVAAWRTRGAPQQKPREATSSPKKLNPVGRTANDVADELARQLDAMNAEAEAALRRRRLAAEASLAEVERLRSAAAEPLVLEPVDSDSSVGDAPQSCRIVHETTALGSNDADEQAYFVESGSESNDDVEEAPAYVVDEGSDTE
jgi:hypothetical protein